MLSEGLILKIESDAVLSCQDLVVHDAFAVVLKHPCLEKCKAVAHLRLECLAPSPQLKELDLVRRQSRYRI